MQIYGAEKYIFLFFDERRQNFDERTKIGDERKNLKTKNCLFSSLM